MEFEKTWTFLEEERGCSMWRPGFAEILIVLVKNMDIFGRRKGMLYVETRIC